MEDQLYVMVRHFALLVRRLQCRWESANKMDKQACQHAHAVVHSQQSTEREQPKCLESVMWLTIPVAKSVVNGEDQQNIAKQEGQFVPTVGGFNRLGQFTDGQRDVNS